MLNKHANEAFKYAVVETEKGNFDTTASAEKDSVDTYSDRTEQLRLIKHKISRGFYNSEKVLNDLSHSFAKAVDTSL
ncbi:hypothetical protein QA601_03035 [Chitinispirillales bacterium ANBcel5]|uniref:hypothetical protein n=1 Tax=Cellulosispirillum alkaliphilum TaxID=3039283 RepID=UPI002A57218D|nr:hypothetical protein [Chitinispirillales bacterium ANBcel5]